MVKMANLNFPSPGKRIAGVIFPKSREMDCGCFLRFFLTSEPCFLGGYLTPVAADRPPVAAGWPTGPNLSVVVPADRVSRVKKIDMVTCTTIQHKHPSAGWETSASLPVVRGLRMEAFFSTLPLYIYIIFCFVLWLQF